MLLKSSEVVLLLEILDQVYQRWSTFYRQILNGFTGILGTIVGSAAFNMLIIIGFCIFAIPDGETRRVDRFPVFGITAIASVFAYIWLLFILKINTEGIVELWEAIVTFL